jgi:hypothetical protein
MLAVRESEQHESSVAGSRSGARGPTGHAAPAAHAPAAALQRCTVAGCGCGGTCAGHAPLAPAGGAQQRDAPAMPAERSGPLPLDATLARAVLARSASERTLARSSSSGSSGGGGGGGGGGGAPVAGAACKVDVRATHIGGILSGLPIWHLLVVTTDGAGTERYYRGGPGGPGGSPTYGSIITNDGLYVAGTVDWSPGAPSRTVMSGPTACGHDACLAAELRRIDGTGTAYAPTGPNSNTVASTILTNCHIPRGKPVWVAPGWDSPAL